MNVILSYIWKMDKKMKPPYSLLGSCCNPFASKGGSAAKSLSELTKLERSSS